jgi:hypothetical protein
MDAGPDACPPGCVPPDHASADCPIGACDFVCDPSFVRRGDSCIEALACTPGLLDTTRVTDTGNSNLEPAVAVSGDVAAVFWIQGSFGDYTRAVNARFYDYPAMTPRTDAQIIASSALYRTDRIDVQPLSTGFAVSYDRVNSTFGGARCHIDIFDRDGVRTSERSDASDGCVRHAFSGDDAGFAIAVGFPQVDARRYDAMGGMASGTFSTRISDAGRTGGGHHIDFDPSRGEYRIAYQVYRGPGAVDLLTATLSTTGFRTSVDTAAVSGFDLVQRAELAYATGGYGLLFEGRPTAADEIEPYLVALDADGVPRSSPVALGVASRAALAASPYELGVTLGRDYDVTLHVRDRAGAPVGAPIDVATGPSHADWPDVAWAGDGFVVAYSDDVAGSGLDDIYVARVCPDR